MGLLIGGGLAVLVIGILRAVCHLRGAALQLVAAALCVGLAGYALQGRAGLLGSPATERTPDALPPAMPIELAAEFYGRFNAASPWLAIANGYMARGDSAGAVQTLSSAIRAYPSLSELWVALGNALVTHNGGRSSPASELAFRKSASLAPNHPGPRFFYGLTLLTQGEIDRGIATWRHLLEQAQPEAEWRSLLAARVSVAERIRAGESAPDMIPTRPPHDSRSR